MSPARPKLVSAAWNCVPGPLRRRLESPDGRRLLRFAPWERRGRPQLFRETLPFVAVSLSVGAVLTEVSHFAYQAGQSMGLRGIEFGLFVQGLYITANVVTFVIRFLIFNYLIFAGRARSIRFAREP